MMNIYEVLEKYVIEYVNSTKSTTSDDFILIKKLNDIIFYSDEKRYNCHYSKKYDLNKVDRLVTEFLNEINPYYKDYYELRKKDGTIFFDKSGSKCDYAYSDYDFENKKRKIYIPLSNSILDIFSISHEIFHDINIDETNESNTRYIFTETLALLSELLLEDYLINKGIKEAKLNNNLNLYYIKLKSIEVDFNLQLIINYLENGYLNKNMIDNILNSYPDMYFNDLNKIVLRILKEQELTVEFEQGYIIGILFATYMYSRINNNKNNIQELFELNEMIKKYDFQQVLDYLQLDYNDIDLTHDSYQKLESKYKKYIKSR